MRVIECNTCGDLLAAANDDELATCVARHMSKEHGQECSSEEAGQAVASRAYDASDS